MTPLLIVTAVAAEADAIRAGVHPLASLSEAAGADAYLRDLVAGTAETRAHSRDLVAGTAETGAHPRGQVAGTAETGTHPRGQVVGAAGAYPGGFVVEVVGVGPAAAAAGTARLLATGSYRGVLSAGIAGGLSGRAAVGATVLGARSIAADLGAEAPDGFLPVEELGFGTSVLDADAELLKALIAALPDAVVGDVLTLSTVTGSAATADRLAERHPAAVAEAMEGYGVASAAAAAGVPFAELRTISNPVGPRDRAAWRLPEALAALRTAAWSFTH